MELNDILASFAVELQSRLTPSGARQRFSTELRCAVVHLLLNKKASVAHVTSAIRAHPTTVSAWLKNNVNFVSGRY